MTEPRRISPPKEYERPIIDKLVDAGLFETKQAAMMFAAALGKRYTGRQEILTRGDGIRWHIFEKANDEAFVNALAITETSDVQILNPEVESAQDVQAIFEEYAAGGFAYLKQHVIDAPGDFLENAVSIVQQFVVNQHPTSPGLEGLDSGTLELIGDLDG